MRIVSTRLALEVKRIVHWCGRLVLDLLEELLLLAALGLLAWGLWQVWPPGAALAAGLILLWVALPPRRPFIHRDDPRPPLRKH